MEKFVKRVSKRSRKELDESEENSHIGVVPATTNITSANANATQCNINNILTDKNHNETGMLSIVH